MATQRSAVACWAGFLLLAVGIGLVLMLVGYLPTRKLGGSDGVIAMIVGCAISVIASALGVLPLVLLQKHGDGEAPDPGRRMTAVMMSMAVRFFLVVFMGVAAALSGMVSKAPLLVWLGVSYLALLIADTAFALKISSKESS